MFQIQVETGVQIPLGAFVWTNLSSQIDNSSPAIIVVPLYMLLDCDMTLPKWFLEKRAAATPNF